MGLKKTAFSTFLLAFALYIFLPTPDQLFIFPTVSLFLMWSLHVPFVYGLMITSLLYYGSGAVAMLGALLIGGKPVYLNLKEKYRARKFQPMLKKLEHK
jgi:hypothetical protein